MRVKCIYCTVTPRLFYFNISSGKLISSSLILLNSESNVINEVSYKMLLAAMMLSAKERGDLAEAYRALRCPAKMAISVETDTISKVLESHGKMLSKSTYCFLRPKIVTSSDTDTVLKKPVISFSSIKPRTFKTDSKSSSLKKTFTKHLYQRKVL